MLTHVPGGAAAQSLMTPYLSFLLSPFVEQLQASDVREEGSFGPTALCVVQSLTKSMNVDEGGSYSHRIAHARSQTSHKRLSLQTAFWRDDRLQQVMPVLVALIASAGADRDAPSSNGTGGREAVSAGIVALGETMTDDALLKRLNLDVLMHTRADDALVRIFALQCACALWTAHGSKLVGAWAFPPSRAMDIRNT
jgi:U3 small nucleolar RNA-associated protein 10